MQLDDLALFVAVVDAGSFTGGAARRGLSKSAASKRVAALEARLGARLLERTTRSMRLTELGRRYYDRAQAIVRAAEEAELEVTLAQGRAVGRLRVSAPVSFGVRHLGGAIAAFVRDHPGVHVEVDLSDRLVDLVEDDYDVAIRAGALEDSSLVARPLMPSRSLVVAAPAYLDREGRPAKPSDLRRHEALLYRHQISGRVWHFAKGRLRRAVRVRGRLVSDSGDILAEACCAGVGVAYLPDFIVGEHVAEGRLEALLEPWCPVEASIQAVYPSRDAPAKVRLFVDAVAEHLRTPTARRRSPP